MKMVKISELRTRDVVNISDGKKLGHVKDIELNLEEGYVTGIVLPSDGTFLKLLFRNNDIFIPWDKVAKIGDDVILVDLQETS